MIKFIKNMFKGKSDSKNAAKKRLQLVLIHDRTDISPEMMENLRKEMIEVINKYLDVDIEHIEMEFEKEEGATALVANIPVISSRREQQAGKTKPENKTKQK